MVKKCLPLKRTTNRFVSFFLVWYYFFQGLILSFIPLSWLPTKQVQNQIVLITGGASGIGRELALRFSELGSLVVLWDIDQQGLKETKEEIINKHKSLCWTYYIDLRQKEAIYKTAKMVRKEVGPVDILINNAGIFNGRLILDLSDDQIESIFKVNTMAHFYMLKAFLPEMIERNQGHIVTVASIAGHVGISYLSDYCSTKFANVGMELALRMELYQAGLDNINTTIVKPFFINTKMFHGIQSGLIPIININNATDKIMQAILTNQKEITIFSSLQYCIAILLLLPNKCILQILDFIGAYDFMIHKIQ